LQWIFFPLLSLLAVGIITTSSRVFKSKYIDTRQQSHRSSHAVPRRIFDDVEEREKGERKRTLSRETTAS
jgi:hypothetical protein